MGRAKKDRPKRYRMYIRTAQEAQNDPLEIPESTLRSQRKRKQLLDLSFSPSSSSSSNHDTSNVEECENEEQGGSENSHHTNAYEAETESNKDNVLNQGSDEETSRVHSEASSTEYSRNQTDNSGDGTVQDYTDQGSDEENNENHFGRTTSKKSWTQTIAYEEELVSNEDDIFNQGSDEETSRVHSEASSTEYSRNQTDNSGDGTVQDYTDQGSDEENNENRFGRTTSKKSWTQTNAYEEELVSNEDDIFNQGSDEESSRVHSEASSTEYSGNQTDNSGDGTVQDYTDQGSDEENNENRFGRTTSKKSWTQTNAYEEELVSNEDDIFNQGSDEESSRVHSEASSTEYSGNQTDNSGDGNDQDYTDQGSDNENGHIHSGATTPEHIETQGNDLIGEAGNPEDNPIDLYKNLRLQLEGSFKDPLNTMVTASVGEILTNALTLVKKHNWNHSEKEDLMKFVNSLLNNSKAVPSSRFLLDKYLYSKEGMQYFFYCSECFQLLLEVPATDHTLSEIMCPNTNCLKINVISDLSKASYFVTYNLPSQLKLLLDDPSVRQKLVNPIDFRHEPEDSIMRDLYHGSAYRSFANNIYKLPNPSNVKYISFSLSVDGASLCSKFSGQSITPCFVMINELPPVVRAKNLLLAGIWFGVIKEKSDLFLPPIVKHITDLSVTGFSLKFDDEVDVWHMKAYLIDCIADSVERCNVQGIHSHRGDFPCSWCMVEGEEYLGSRVFPYEPLPGRRTMKNLWEDSREAARTKSFVHGVKYFCLLGAAPYFDSVNGFIVDQMHAKDEGCTKAFLNSWLGEDGKTSYYIGPSNIKKVNNLLHNVKVPREFRKTVRTLKHLSYWTGREFENWCFFLSLPTLSGLLPNRYLKHWALYVQGTYLLLMSAIHTDVVKIAHDLLEEFCMNTEQLYGKHMMRFNLHVLRHFAENCLRWGPLFALSAYALQAGNQRAKKKVHDCNGVPNQLCRGISEDNALIILKKSCDSDFTKSFEKSIEPKSHSQREKLVNNLKLLGISKIFRASREEEWHFERAGVDTSHCSQYKLIEKEGCKYGPALTHENKADNSYARLKDLRIIKIEKIVHNEKSNDVFVMAHRVRCEPSKYCPQSVVQYDVSLCCQFTVSSIDEDIVVIDASELETVCVNINNGHEQCIIPMPNILNMY